MSNNDLISRSALKKKLQSRYDNGEEDFDKGYNIGIETAIDLIDNAPTVVVGYLTNCANCEKVEKIRAKRPQGKWVRTGSMTKRSYQRMCDNCHNIVYFCGNGNYPNCPYCLADMKGGAE